MNNIVGKGCRCAAVLALLAALACSSGTDTTSGPSGTDGSAGTGGDAGAGGSGGAGAGQDGCDASTGSDAGGTAQGFFTVVAYLPTMPPAGTSGGVNAVYTKTSQAPPQAGCTRRTVAGCLIDECADVGTSDAGTPMASPHAGMLTLSGTGVDVKVALTPSPLGQYGTGIPPGTGSRFLGGEPAKLVATGGDVPAFEINTIYPLLLLLDQPKTTTGQLVAPRTQDLSLAWSRGTQDGLFYLRGNSSKSMGTIGIVCLIPSSNGSLTLPAAELARFNTGTMFTLASFNKASARAGAYEADLVLGGEV